MLDERFHIYTFHANCYLSFIFDHSEGQQTLSHGIHIYFFILFHSSLYFYKIVDCSTSNVWCFNEKAKTVKRERDT